MSIKQKVLLWICFHAARLMTWWYGRKGIKAYNLKVSVGGGSSSGSNSFSRTGTESKQSTFTLPTELSSLIDGANSNMSLSSSDPHTTLISSLLSQDPTSIQGSTQLNDLMDKTRTDMPWYSNLLSLSQVDPYSSEYENATQSGYVNRLQNDLAALDSANVRTGTNHQALMKGQAVADATRDRSADLARQRGVDAGVALNSMQLLNALEQFLGGQTIAAQNAAQGSINQRVAQALQAGDQRTARGTAAAGAAITSARARGTSSETISSNMSGAGQQSNSNFTWGTGGGMDCCWIFLTSFNGYPGGELPAFVRRGRDEFQTPEGVRGYKWMSRWLVPRMQKSWLWKFVVNSTMVWPITLYGAYRYQAEHTGRRWGWLFKPVLHGWLKVWQKIGVKYG